MSNDAAEAGKVVLGLLFWPALIAGGFWLYDHGVFSFADDYPYVGNRYADSIGQYITV